MGMPVANRFPAPRGGIISRTDPRITGGVTAAPPVAQAPVDPLPRSTTQPVGGRSPAPMPREGALAGAGGVPGGRMRPGAGRGAGAGLSMRGGIGTPGFTKRQASTPPWLRAQPSSAVIGG